MYLISMSLQYCEVCKILWDPGGSERDVERRSGISEVIHSRNTKHPETAHSKKVLNFKTSSFFKNSLHFIEHEQNSKPRWAEHS